MTRQRDNSWGLVLGVVLAVGCRSSNSSAPVDEPPGSEQVVDPRSDQPSARSAQSLASPPWRRSLEEFADELVQGVGDRPGSLGVLPLVSHDKKKEAPWVSEFGVTVADDLAEVVTEQGYDGFVLGSSDMELRLQEANLGKATIAARNKVSEFGERLGVDVLVYGSTKREVTYQGPQRIDSLRMELNAYDFRTGSILARHRLEIPGQGSRFGEAWRLQNQESLWQILEQTESVASDRTFAREVPFVCGQVARRLLGQWSRLPAGSRVYVPPTDTSRFVHSLARLRAAQRTFASEYERLREELPGAENKPARSREVSFVLNDVQFRNLAQAVNYLNQLEEGLQATQAARFGQSLSSMVAEKLLEQWGSGNVQVNDLGFTELSDTERHATTGELSSGGLVRSLTARETLRNAGIEFVVLPRLERWGDDFLLRLELLDLQASSILGSTHGFLASAYAADLQQALGLDEAQDPNSRLAPIDDLQSSARKSWDSVYESVAAGVVRLTGNQSSGTGFLVSADGHVMTNAHVSDAVAGPDQSALAVTKDGAQIPVKVLVSDRFWDVAVVKLERVPEDAHIFEFAEEADARIGVEIAVLGHPKDFSGWILSPGHLSSVSEKVPVDTDQDGSADRARPSFMYTAPTRQGTSGGPVLLLDSRVVAVNSHVFSGEVYAEESEGKPAPRTELTGFALGAPGHVAKGILEKAVTRSE